MLCVRNVFGIVLYNPIFKYKKTICQRNIIKRMRISHIHIKISEPQ